MGKNVVEAALDQRERQVRKVSERVHQYKLEQYEQGNELIRKGADKDPIQREDEFPMSWGHGRDAPSLQVPLPPFTAAPSLIPPHITNVLDPDFQRRNAYWQAFARRSAEAGASHAATSVALSTYFDAAHDPDLGAMNYSIGAEEVIDVGTATDREIVPNQRPRRPIGELFNQENELDIDPLRDGFTAVAYSVKEGNSGAKSANEEAQRADEAVRIQMKELQARAERLKGSNLRLSSSVSDLAAFTSRQAGHQAAGEIEDLKDQAEAAGDAVATIFDVVAGLVHFAKGDIGDGIEKMGDLAAKAASHMNDDEIAHAKSKLHQIRIDEAQLSRTAQLQKVGARAFEVRAALTEVENQRNVVRSAVGARKTAYGSLGQASAKAVPSAPGKDKVAATLAAIPLVEMVVAKAREIRLSAHVPAADAAAARGLRIAHDNQHPSAKSFLVTCDQLKAAHTRGESEEKKWASRRDQLFRAKESMFGRRPGPRE